MLLVVNATPRPLHWHVRDPVPSIQKAVVNSTWCYWL